MTTHAYLSGERLSFAGKRPPFTFAVLPMIALAGLVALYVAAGFSDGAFVAVMFMMGACPVALYVLSIVRNYLRLDPDALRLCYWIVNPLNERVVPYDSIFDIEADDVRGELTIKYRNAAGESDITGILFANATDASTVRDEIRVRQSAPSFAMPEANQSRSKPPTAIELPVGDEQRKFKVQFPKWPWMGIAMIPPMSIAMSVADGQFSPLYWLYITAFITPFFVLIVVAWRFKANVILHADHLDISPPASPTQRVPYNSVVAVESRETGMLAVTFIKQPKLLRRGGGEEVVSVVLSPHSAAAVVAETIKAARERIARSGIALPPLRESD